MKNENIKISIIIPVYNVEPYLRECLDSVINQTLKEIEIICIDDCSTDNSYQILEEYAKKDSRIIVLKNEKNSGQGPSRNRGIKISNGEYIFFMDSDDYISPNFVDELYKTGKQFNSDIVTTFNIYNYINKKLSKTIWNTYYNTKKEKNKIYTNPFDRMRIYLQCNKIYKREFLINNSLFFDEIKGGSEDSDFNLRVSTHEPSININNNAVYYYRIRNDSSFRTISINYTSALNSIKHMENSINYCKNTKPELLKYIYKRVWHPPCMAFIVSIDENKQIIYPYIYEFSKKIHMNIEDIDMNYDGDVRNYIEYLLIKDNPTYEEYLKTKNTVNEITNNFFINKNIEKDKTLILFGIINSKTYLKIIFFGMKITFKKKS